MNDEKTHAAINSKLFNRLGHINDQLQEKELAKCNFEHKEPRYVGYFTLQYAQLKKLKLICNFLAKFCETKKYEEMETDTY